MIVTVKMFFIGWTYASLPISTIMLGLITLASE
jgi:hypothetical protein